MAAPILTDQNFAQVVTAAPMIIVDFYGDKCVPCRQIAPLIEQLHQKGAQQGFSVAKVNVDQAPGVTRAMNVLSTPTLIIFENGRESARFVGGNNILFKLRPLLR